MAVTSIRSNSQPAGGTTAQQSVQPIGSMTPADVAALVDQLMPANAKFRANSSPLQVNLNQHVYTVGAGGQQSLVQIASVGLGMRIVAHHHIAVSLINAATAAQAVSLGSWYPFNLISNTQVQVNGGATVYSASGDGGLPVALRDRRSCFRLDTTGGYGPALSPAICNITVGANGTATNAAAARIPAQLSGITSVSVAGSSTAIITADFVTVEWFVLNRDSMLGALPLQNNSTYATVTRTLAASFLGADDSFPFWVSGGVPGTLTASIATNMYTNSIYEFASVPADPSLYTAMVANSYQVQEQPGLQVGSTGTAGFVYNIPQNQYLIALHRIMRNGASTKDPVAFSALLGGQTAGFSNYGAAAYSVMKRYVQYNAGSVIPILQFPQRYRGDKFLAYGADLSMLPGYALWDGEDTSNALTQTDEMGWIDAYNVATPQLVEDLGASITVGTAKVVRESVVPGSVAVVGG